MMLQLCLRLRLYPVSGGGVGIEDFFIFCGHLLMFAEERREAGERESKTRWTPSIAEESEGETPELSRFEAGFSGQVKAFEEPAKWKCAAPRVSSCPWAPLTRGRLLHALFLRLLCSHGQRHGVEWDARYAAGRRVRQGVGHVGGEKRCLDRMLSTAGIGILIHADFVQRLGLLFTIDIGNSPTQARPADLPPPGCVQKQKEGGEAWCCY